MVYELPCSSQSCTCVGLIVNRLAQTWRAAVSDRPPLNSQNGHRRPYVRRADPTNTSKTLKTEWQTKMCLWSAKTKIYQHSPKDYNKSHVLIFNMSRMSPKLIWPTVPASFWGWIWRFGGLQTRRLAFPVFVKTQCVRQVVQVVLNMEGSCFRFHEDSGCSLNGRKALSPPIQRH